MINNRNTEIYLSKLWQINKVRAAFGCLKSHCPCLECFQPTELNLHRLMFYKLGHSTYTQTENQQYNNTYVNNIKKKTPHTHTYTTVFVPSDSPLKVSVVRLCSRSALSTLVCPQNHTHTHTHTHAHTHIYTHTHTIAESLESKLWCDYIFFKDCLLLLFKQCVFRRWVEMKEGGFRRRWGQRGRHGQTDGRTEFVLSEQPTHTHTHAAPGKA